MLYLFIFLLKFNLNIKDKTKYRESFWKKNLMKFGKEIFHRALQTDQVRCNLRLVDWRTAIHIQYVLHTINDSFTQS